MSAIPDVASLKKHLQGAMVLEHATIPAYLTALYSIKDGHNTEAAQVIQSVVMEEMLHMTLVGNVLNALDSHPVIDSPDFVPSYPGPLPYSDGSFEVGLLKFSPEALETFLRIELPEAPGAPPEPDKFHTIGQFYDALIEALKTLDGEADGTIFVGNPDYQIQPEHYYYGGGGGVVPVTCLDSAVHALEEVMEQGEGHDHSIYDGDHKNFGQDEEVAHYYRFNEIALGRYYGPDDKPSEPPSGTEMPVDWSAVWNMAPNPKSARYEEDQPEVYALMQDFNRQYTGLLRQLHAAFNGDPQQLMKAVPTMYELKYAAQGLMKIPTGVGDTTVGPSWEYHP